MTTTRTAEHFDRQYQTHLKHLKLKGLQPKTIDAYARAIRRIGAYFDHQIDALTEAQLTDYFTDLIASHSWTTVKLDLYGLKFYTTHVLRKPWVAPGLIKPPRTQRLPDIVTVAEVQQIIAATHVLSYRAFFFTLYSLGLRLGEGLRLQVGDIDAVRGRVHIRDAKGNRDRFVPLPQATHQALQRFWQVHRNPVLLFPNRHTGLNGARSATTPLDRGGVQVTLHKVTKACGLKKRSPPTVCVTHLIEAGVDLIEVQKFLGHHSILTTARYTHLTETRPSITPSTASRTTSWRSIETGSRRITCAHSRR
jgi:site-specific recombinase XerD